MAIVPSIKNLAAVMTIAMGLSTGASAQLLNETEQAAPKQQASEGQAQFSSSTSVFDAWSLHCRSSASRQNCYVETILLSKGNRRQELLKLRVNKADDGYIFIGTVPEGVSLDAPFIMSVGEERYPLRYRRCATKRCTASDKLDLDVTSSVLKEEQILVTFFTYSREAENGRQPNTFPIATKGLGAALKALSQ